MNFFRDVIAPPFELIWSKMVWLGAHPWAIAILAVLALFVLFVFRGRRR